MANSIHDAMVNPGLAVYYQADFRQVVETYVAYLREHPKTRIVSIEPDVAYRYEGDFYGLLKTVGVPYHHHWIALRMNGLIHPADFTSIVDSVIIPDINVIENIVRLFNVTHKIS